VLDYLILVWALASLSGAAWFALRRNRIFQKEYPRAKPYRWGYFWGMLNLLTAPLYPVLLFKGSDLFEVAPLPFTFSPATGLLFLFWILAVLGSFRTLVRDRWGLAVSAAGFFACGVLAGDVILITYGGLTVAYLARRWTEMSVSPRLRRSQKA